VEYKTCSSCKTAKETSYFSSDKQKKDGLSSRCKVCDSAKVRSYYNENKDKARSRQKKYVANSQELYKEGQKRYYENNKEKFRAKEILRKHYQNNQTPEWLNKAHKAEIEGFYMFCKIFSSYKTKKSDTFQVDHIVPIKGKQVSGLHVPWNLHVLTCRDNAQKSNTFNPRTYQQQGICAFME
jgi:hypothetical protein